MNDGLLDMKLITKPFESFADFGQFMRNFENGGINQYFDDVYRVKTVKFENRNYDAEGYLQPQYIILDGEPQMFTHFFKVQVEKEGLELIVDLDRVIEMTYTDNHRYRPEPPKKPSSAGSMIKAAVAILGAVAAWKYRDEIKQVVSDLIQKK